MIEDKKQFTFEEIGILDEQELQKLSNEFDNGYGGCTPSELFERLLPKGYSFAFIKELLSERYLCMIYGQQTFEKYLEEYRNTPVVVYEQVHCKTCGKGVKTICRHYKRVGVYLNEPGELIETTEYKN